MNIVNRFSVLPALLLVLDFCCLANAQEQKLERLLQRSPLPSNSICYLHTQSLKKLLTEAKLTLELADKVEEVWLVSDLDLDELKPNWEAGYATVKQPVEAVALARNLGGYVDHIGKQEAIWTPKQSFILPLKQDLIGFLRPAKRNLLADWLDGPGNNPISAYLATQVKQPEQYLSFMVAIDLRNTISPVNLASRLATFESLKNQDAQSVANLLSTVQGVSLIVGRQSLSECILTVEFSQSPAALSTIGSLVLSEVLNQNGTGAPEVASWKTKVDGNKLTFQGPISAESLDGVLGIFSIRGYAEEVTDRLAPMSLSTQGSSSAMQVASKEYFDKVNAFIERVRKYEAQSSGYRAKWNDQQARRIDELGTLNVDPQVIEYGANVASVLRGNATSIRLGNVAAGQVQASQMNSSGYYGGYYGSVYGDSYVSNQAAMNNAMTTGSQQLMAAGGSYRVALANIDQMTGAIRRAMTEKYKVQF